MDISTCFPCAGREYDNMLPHPEYLCRLEQKLSLLNGIPAINNSITENCKCYACGKEDMEIAYICPDCYECYCLKCSKKLY